MPVNQAASDLNEKLRLEFLLSGDISKFNRLMTRETIKLYGLTGRALQAEQLRPELEEILLKHYERVEPSFSGQMSEQLPDDIEETSAERAIITAALASFFATRAPQQSKIITATNQRDIDDSIARAIEMTQEDALAGRRVSQRETAMLVGANLSRKLTGRITGIASLETQASAEASKATEVQVLIGQQPSVIGGSPQEAPIKKTWFTVGDERVRASHVIADSQEQNINAPYEVGGQLLRWPGDTSLGATAGNVINCRCSSRIEPNEFFAERRRRGEAPRIDQTASEQLLTSIGEL